MAKKIYFKFIDMPANKSRRFGPYKDAIITYGTLRVPCSDGSGDYEDLAELGNHGFWIIKGNEKSRWRWTDLDIDVR